MTLLAPEPVKTTIYRKTAKGQAEIETRAHRLTPRLRGGLIMVDGQRDVEALFKLIPGEPEATLQQLLADGFIDVVAAAAERPATTSQVPPAAAPTARKPAPPAASIDVLKRDTVRYLTDRLGPAAESLSMKIERSSSMAELQPQLAQAAQLLRNFGGNAAADAFIDRFIGSQA